MASETADATTDKRTFDWTRLMPGPGVAIFTLMFAQLAITVAMFISLRSDIADTRTELRAEIVGVRSELRTEIVGLRSGLRTEIADTRAELHAEINSVEQAVRDTRAELHAAIADTRAELHAAIADTRAELRAEIADTRADLRAEIVAVGQRVTALGGRIRPLEDRMTRQEALNPRIVSSADAPPSPANPDAAAGD